MKKWLLGLLALATISTATAFAACEETGSNQGGGSHTEQGGGEQGGGTEQGGGKQEETKKKIEGIAFTGEKSFTYDGTEKEIKINEADLPEGVAVAYAGNKAQNAGTYEATATLSGEGYQTLTLTQKWTIEKATLSGISAEATQQLNVDGSAHFPAYTGELPTGVSVQYYLDGKADLTGAKSAGGYAYTLVFGGNNYAEFKLDVTLNLIGKIEGAAFASTRTFTYDGTAKKLLIDESTLPEGVSVQYANNEKTNAGEYKATAILTGTYFETATISASWTIEKATLSGISATATQQLTVDGDSHFPAYKGTLPSGVSVKYLYNNVVDTLGAKTRGAYDYILVFDGDNYKQLSLSVKLTLVEKITGVDFVTARTFTYDGTQKKIVVDDGTLPGGVSVKEYTNNAKTDAGEYKATATLTGDYFETMTITATWTIEKANITGISVEEKQSVTVDGEYHFPEITGVIDTSVLTAKWYLNGNVDEQGAKEKGTYTYTLVISGKNYNELRLETVLKMKVSLAGVAKQVIDAFGEVPEPWSFLPDSFAMKNKVMTDSEIVAFVTPENAYASFVDVSSIPTNYIGKQLNVVYGVLSKMETALSYVNTVYQTLSAVQNLYQTFLNDDPDDYQTFSATANGFAFKLTLKGDIYYLEMTVKNVQVRLFADETDKKDLSYGARIQLTSDTVLKYTVSDNDLKIGLVVLGSASTQVEFLRKDGVVTGYIYENLTVAGKTVSTSALLTVGEKYLTVVGTKGDFILASNGRNCEIYSVTTGKFVGSEVRETMKTTTGGSRDCNTLWYNLRDLQGINTIKKVDEQNYPNADTIYINSATEAIHSMTVKIPTDLSRRFDIEYKAVCAYQKVVDEEGTVSYEKVEFEVPMLFVQEEQLDTFEDDFYSKNKAYLTSAGVTLNVTAADKAAVKAGYYNLVDAYDAIKNLVTIDMVKAYCEIVEEETTEE